MFERTVYIGADLDAAINSIAGVLDDDACSVTQFLLYTGAASVLAEARLWKQHANAMAEGDRLLAEWFTRVLRNFTVSPEPEELDF